MNAVTLGAAWMNLVWARIATDGSDGGVVGRGWAAGGSGELGLAGLVTTTNEELTGFYSARTNDEMQTCQRTFRIYCFVQG
jgi:hypothetical protein